MTNLVSKKCIDFVKDIEGFEPYPKDDGFGFITLGYGMTGKEIEGIDYVTKEQASNMLESLLNKKYAPPIKNDLDCHGSKLNQNEFDALISMAYNIGICGLLGSTLYRNVVAGVRDKATITSNFQAWSMAGGNIEEGLYRRRTEESEMFFSGETVLKKNSYCLKWQVFFNKTTNSKKQLSTDGLAGGNTLKSLDFLLGYVKQSRKYKYCKEFQIFYNKTTETGAPISTDGYWGTNTENAYEKMIKLIKGEY